MKKLRIAAFALASVLLALPAGAKQVPHEWWNVDFTSPTPVTGIDGYGNVTLVNGQLGNLTNEYRVLGLQQPYASGYWTAEPGDETVVTNGVTTNVVDGVAAEQDPNDYLALNTQGNSLTWTPTNEPAAGGLAVSNVLTLVDADLYLVGSDSAPDPAEFDSVHDVQTAIYLKNYVDDAGTGDTTNSFLCVYAYDSGTGQYVWQELEGAEIADNSWHRVRVEIAYADGEPPVVHVTVDNHKMYLRGGNEENNAAFTAANTDTSMAKARVTSVSFRGTGKLDNFVATTVEDVPSYLDFTAEVYWDNEFVATNATGTFANWNKTIVSTSNEVKTASTVEFKNSFRFADVTANPSWILSSVELFGPDGTSDVYTYSRVTGSAYTFIQADQPDDNPVSFALQKIGSNFRQSGVFSLLAPTEGFESNAVVAKIYFNSIGAFNAFAETDLDGTFSTNNVFVKPPFPVTTNWTFNATENGNKLTRVETFNGAKASFNETTRQVTVSVTIPADTFSADTRFAKATYVAGAYGETAAFDWDESQSASGIYTLNGGVAKVISAPDAETGACTTNFCDTVAAAVASVPDGGTVVLIATVAESVRHTRQDVAFTLDLNGQNWNYVFDDNYAAFKNDGGVVTIVDSVGTGKIEVAPNPNFATDEADGFCVWARTGSIVIEGGSFVNDSNVDYAAYVGTYDNKFWNGAPTITILGGTFTNKNTEPYGHNPSLGHSLNLNVINTDSTHLLARTELIQAYGGTFTYDPALGDDVMGGSFVAPGYASVPGDGVWTVMAAAVQILEDETHTSFLTISNAQEAAETAGIDDPTFVIVLPLSAETVTLATTNELFTVQTTNTEYTLNLTVDTSLVSSDALVYTVVGPMTVTDSMVDPPVSTITWYVKADEYVAKIVNADTTIDRYETFTNAANAAVADGTTVVMVADDRATTYTLADGAKLSVEEGTFAVPTVVPATLADYYISNVVSGGITTYKSMPYLLARFKNNDDSPVATVKVRANEAPVPPEAPAAAVVTEGYDAAFAGWSPAVGAISSNTNYKATYTETPHPYTITYLGLNGTARLADGTPETYTIVTPTFSIPAPVVTNGTVVFVGWLDDDIVDADVYVSEIAQGSTGDRHLFAEFKNVIEVTFLDTAGSPPLFGEGETAGKTNFVEGTQIAWPFEEAPAKPEATATAGWAYEFYGWATNQTDAAAGVTNALPLASPTGAKTFYAVFTSNAVEYAIDVALNGGQWGAIYLPPQTYTVTNEQISIPDPVHEYPEDYAFAGWTNALGEAVEAVIPAGSTGDKFFGATWSELKRVTFSNGRLGYDDLATNVVAGTKLAQPETPAGIAPVDTVAGFAYDFAGWALPETEDPVEWPQEITTDVNYHAVFTSNAIVYHIYVDLDGGDYGDGAVPIPETYTVTNDTIALTDGVFKDGFRFLNWTNELGAQVTEIAAGSTGDKHLYAVWEEIPQEPLPVDAGREIDPVADGVKPVEIVGTTIKVSFHAPQAGVRYELVAAGRCDLTDEQWKGTAQEGNAETFDPDVAPNACHDSTAVDDLITLEAPMGDATKKFYKIKAYYPGAGN